MRTRKEIFKGLLFISLFMTFIYLCIPSSNYTQCQLTEQFYDLEFEGIVENAYIDRSDHSLPYFVVRNETKFLDTISLFGEWNELFKFIKVGDTLKKERKSNLVFRKENLIYRPFKIAKFQCDTIELNKEKPFFKLYNFVGTN